MQHLVNFTNEKSVSSDPSTIEILNQATKLCILVLNLTSIFP